MRGPFNPALIAVPLIPTARMQADARFHRGPLRADEAAEAQTSLDPRLHSRCVAPHDGLGKRLNPVYGVERERTQYRVCRDFQMGSRPECHFEGILDR